jgi:hypothetical protein
MAITLSPTKKKRSEIISCMVKVGWTFEEVREIS